MVMRNGAVIKSITICLAILTASLNLSAQEVSRTFELAPQGVVIDFNHDRLLALVDENSFGFEKVSLAREDFLLNDESVSKNSELLSTINADNLEFFSHFKPGQKWVDITSRFPSADRLFKVIGSQLKNPAGLDQLANYVNCHWTTAVLNGLVSADHLFENLDKVTNFSEKDYMDRGYGELDAPFGNEAQVGFVYRVDPLTGDIEDLEHSFTVIPGTSWGIQKDGFGGNNPFDANTVEAEKNTYAKDKYLTIVRYFTKDPDVLRRHPSPLKWAWQDKIAEVKARNTALFAKFSGHLNQFPRSTTSFFEPFDRNKDRVTTAFAKTYFELLENYTGQRFQFFMNPASPKGYVTWYELNLQNSSGSSDLPAIGKKVASPTRQVIEVSSREDAAYVLREIQILLLLSEISPEIYSDFNPQTDIGRMDQEWYDPMTHLSANIETRKGKMLLVITSKQDPNVESPSEPFQVPLVEVALALATHNGLGTFN
jgi:hypothetical protein